MEAALLVPGHAQWPHQLSVRLGQSAPPSLQVVGPPAVLTGNRTALFCSTHTPGEAILRALDGARHLRDAGATVISGFQSPLEKDCLEILLRGRQPIILCPGRTIEHFRVPSPLRPAFEAGRILFLTPFAGGPKRVTAESAFYRNQVVAALADSAFIPHIRPGSSTGKIADQLKQWGVPITDAY